MEVGLHPIQEPGHGVLRRRRDLRALALHDGQQLGHHLGLLVAAKEVGHEAGGEDVVDVLEEALLLDVLVGEEEGGALALDAAGAEQDLQVFNKVGGVVGSRHCYLKDRKTFHTKTLQAYKHIGFDAVLRI